MWITLKSFAREKLPLYALIILVPFALEHSSEFFEFFLNECEGGQHGLAAKATAAYLGAMDSLSPFEITANNVRIVIINSAIEGDWIGNPCDLRQFTGKVLQTIVQAHPSAIILDWSNAPKSCLDEKRNENFKDQIRQANALVPITFGRSTWSERSLRRNPELAQSIPEEAFGGGRFIAEQDLLDALPINFGLMRLNCDVRKIPLGWEVYPNLEAAQKAKKVETKPPAGVLSRLAKKFSLRPSDLAPRLSNNTLSVLAVMSSNNAESMKRRRLEKLLKNNSHPFAHLFRSVESVEAVELLCEDKQNAGSFSPEVNCTPGPKQKKRLERLRSKIVLIAAVSGEEDLHESPIGNVPGIVLHANYIESLISGHYWKPTPWYAQFVISLIWFAAIETLFHLYRSQPWKAIGYVVAATLLFALTFYYFVVMLMGYYFILLPPSLILILIRSWQLISEREETGKNHVA